MNHDLIERYIYAVTKRLPAKSRKDIAAELHSLIDDLLEERCGEITPAEKDIRVVLTDLGTPDELYQKYSDDKVTCLIGEPYYSSYKLVLKIVSICVVFGLSVAALITQLTDPAEIWFIAFFQWIGMIISGFLFSFGFLTLLFAFFYRKGISIDTSQDLSSLPLVPKEKEGISKGDCIFGIAVSILGVVFLYFVPNIICGVFTNEQGIKEVVPVFNITALRSSLNYLLAFALLGIAKESVRLFAGRYNLSVMCTTIGTNLLLALLSTVWLTKYSIINDKFTAGMLPFFEGTSSIITNAFTNPEQFLLAVILFAFVLDTALVIYYTLKYGKENFHLFRR